MQTTQQRSITIQRIHQYTAYLHEEERSASTIQKYIHDLMALYGYLKGKPLTKINLIHWKEQLITKYAPTSINSIFAAINGFFDFCGWPDLKIKPLKIQKSMFCDEKKILSREEYIRLIHTANAKGKERLALVIQTIAATGIRVSELKYITVASMTQ